MVELLAGNWLTWLAGTILLLGAVEEVLRRLLFKPIRRLFRKAEAIADTWNGEPERDGLPARPGVIERIVGIEAKITVNGTGLNIGDAMAVVLANQAVVKTDLAAAMEDLAQLKDGQAEAKAEAGKAATLAAEIDERVTPWIDRREALLEMYRSTLVEFGFDEDLPRRSPERRDRKEDKP